MHEISMILNSCPVDCVGHNWEFGCIFHRHGSFVKNHHQRAQASCLIVPDLSYGSNFLAISGIPLDSNKAQLGQCKPETRSRVTRSQGLSDDGVGREAQLINPQVVISLVTREGMLHEDFVAHHLTPVSKHDSLQHDCIVLVLVAKVKQHCSLKIG